MCVGKALTGGYLTLAATLCTAEVAAGHLRRRGAGARAHVHGQPAGLRGGQRLHRAAAGRRLGRAGRRGSSAGLRAGLEPLRGAPGVADVRVLGAIGVVQLDHEVDLARPPPPRSPQGVWLRPFRDLVYTMPPYVTDDADLARIAAGVAAAVAAG